MSQCAESLVENVLINQEFRFYPLNHSVARADFKNPCFPYELTGAGKVGFWSGFEPINVVTSDVSSVPDPKTPQC